MKRLAGYKIYYGRSPEALKSVTMVPDPKITSYEIQQLAPGRWYFSVAAYTSDGTESARSAPVFKDVP
jgi:hypothetical protein